MFITTPIPYANGTPHLGHLLEAVFNDSVARYFRSKNGDKKTDVLLTMGIDQHGTKIYEKALSEGLEPEEFALKIGQTFIDLWAEFGIKPEAFIQTHSPIHQRVSQILWRKLQEGGFLFKKKYVGNYCVGCEEFKTESTLVDKKCPLHPNLELKVIEEENYFFKLSAFQNQVEEFLEKTQIRPSYAKTEWQNFVKEGLQDISASRESSKMPWGVPVPNDEAQVMYVWVEALINYATACVINDANFDKLTDDEVLQIIKKRMPINLMYCGKDIAKFHVIIWPAMLLALGFELPQKVIVHGFINDGLGRKFSKSLGNGIAPADVIEKCGIDGTRFILLHEINVDGDTNFSMDLAVEAYNSHLADNLGNLVMRVSNLVEKNLDGVADVSRFEQQFPLPPDKGVSRRLGGYSSEAETLSKIISENIQFVRQNLAEFDEKMSDVDVRSGLDCLLKICRNGNELLEQTQPWKMAKNSQENEAREVLEFLVWTLTKIGSRVQIFMPESGRKITEVFAASQIKKAEVLFQKYRPEKPIL